MDVVATHGGILLHMIECSRFVLRRKRRNEVFAFNARVALGTERKKVSENDLIRCGVFSSDSDRIRYTNGRVFL